MEPELDSGQVDLIPFQKPVQAGKCLYITGIPASLPYEEKWGQLQQGFSAHGLLFEIYLPAAKQAPPLPSTSDPGPQGQPAAFEYALVTFYSRRAAAAAQKALDGRLLMAGRTLKVQLSTRRSLPSLPLPPLRISRCQELANHYLGFNGWSVRIISLVPVSTTDTSASEGKEEVCYRCEAGLEVRGWEGESEGVGVGRVELENPGPLERVRAIGMAQKQAYCRACEHAFSKVVIAVLPTGKVGVQVLLDPAEQMQQTLGGLLESCPPVRVQPQNKERSQEN